MRDLRSNLTRLYARRLGGVTDVSEYTAGGVTETIYWFDSEGKRMGDYSLFGTLLVNERAKRDFSEDVVDYVFLHEVGHDQMGLVGRTLFWALYLLSGVLGFSTVVGLPITVGRALQVAPSLIMLPVYLAVAVAVSLVFLLPFVLVSWIDETLADLFAISKLGRSQYRAVRAETKKESTGDTLHRARIRLQYPPDSVILWIAHRRCVDGE